MHSSYLSHPSRMCMCLSACGSMDLEPTRLLCPWGFPGKISSSRGSFQPKDLNPVSCIGRRILYHWVIWEALFLGQITFYACKCLFVKFGFLYFHLFGVREKVKVLFAHPCLILCDPMEWGPPGSSVHRISQATILEWVVISFSRGSLWPMSQTWVFWVSCITGDSLQSELPEVPFLKYILLQNTGPFCISGTKSPRKGWILDGYHDTLDT